MEGHEVSDVWNHVCIAKVRHSLSFKRSITMADSFLDIQRVAVIGAGVSGVAGAIHLKRAGLEVKVYERTARAGGIW